MKKNRVVITGSSGFIGSNLVRRLNQLGYNNLVLVDRKSNQGVRNSNSVMGDFSYKDLMSKTIKKNDIVVHLACSSIPATSESDREKDIKENIIGSLNFLDVCVKKGIGKFIFISSGGTVYGDYGKKLVKEKFSCNPINSHGVMKLAIENFLHTYDRLYNLNYVIARPGNLYGRLSDRDRKQGAIDVFLSKVVNSEPIEIWGDGSVVRDYVFIDDAVDFLIRAIKKPVHGVFNVGTGRGFSLNDIVKIINKITKIKNKVVYLPARKFDIPHIVLDSGKAKKFLGWNPKINIEEGVRVIFKKISNK